MENRTAETRTVTITFGADGIIVIRSRPDLLQNESDARENLATCRQLAGDKKAPVLVDVRKMAPLARQARDVYATEADFALAQAMLVESAFTRISANLFIRVGRPVHPTRMFTSEDEARQWLMGFLA
jgi:hypothetical protein